MFRPACGSSVSAGHATAAGPAGPSTRRLRQNGRSPKAWPPPLSSPISCSPNTAITCRSTGKARSSPGRASRSTAPPWPIGSAAPAGGSSRYRRDSPSTSLPRISCLPTTRRSRCLIPGADAPKLAACGYTPGTTGPGRAQIRRPRSISTAQNARPSARPLTWRGSAVFCRSTAIRLRSAQRRRHSPRGVLGARPPEVL
jgi:hypothetical protein